MALDTAVFIYFIEEHPAHLATIAPLFTLADAGERDLVTSGLTLLEVLVVPHRKGKAALADRYEALLTRSRGLRLVEPDLKQLRVAAAIRAAHAVRTPDALQLAAALTTGCTAFVTNDRRLPDLPGLEILQLDDYR